jgi:hypothetical protein
MREHGGVGAAATFRYRSLFDGHGARQGPSKPSAAQPANRAVSPRPANRDAEGFGAHDVARDHQPKLDETPGIFAGEALTGIGPP